MVLVVGVGVGLDRSTRRGAQEEWRRCLRGQVWQMGGQRLGTSVPRCVAVVVDGGGVGNVRAKVRR